MYSINIRSADYLLMRFCQRAQPMLRRLGEWETRFLDGELAARAIDRPVFITGLARSGTTLLLELLASIRGWATHRYRDFPFLMIPYWWNRYLDWFPTCPEPVERPHRDGIQITRESPESMEEPLWRAFFPHRHSAAALQRMTADDADPAFERFYTAHIRKVLLVRGGQRYLAKDNYHVARLEYLVRLFPDCRFLMLVRHPITHIHSLVRQHRLFCGYAAEDARVPRCLEAAGHFEFGPQRRPVRLNAEQTERTLAAWTRGDDYAGYAIQWHDVYRFVDTLRSSNPEVAHRMHVVRYEDLCEEPERMMRVILRTVEVDEQDAQALLPQLSRVRRVPPTPEITGDERRAILTEVADVAALYGYPRSACSC